MNPVIPGWYADPELHFLEGRFWLYPTFSAPYEEQTFFEAFSSENLVDWTPAGVILDFKDVPWSTNKCAWAPSAAERNGKFYFCFSAGDGAGLGMAIADHPQGPFKDAIGKPLVVEYHHGAEPIDAHIFQDDDGTPYLYWGGWKHCVVAKLADDLLSLVEEPVEVTPKDYVEGPFMLKRDGTYYLMWSQGGWTNETYCVAYGRSDNPYGPFENEGIILRNQPGMVGAGHHSVLEHDGRYHMAYHRRAVESKSPHERFTCIDEMHFRPDGSIETVIQS